MFQKCSLKYSCVELYKQRTVGTLKEKREKITKISNAATEYEEMQKGPWKSKELRM
jgi:hypothetical protein